MIDSTFFPSPLFYFFYVILYMQSIRLIMVVFSIYVVNVGLHDPPKWKSDEN